MTAKTYGLLTKNLKPQFSELSQLKQAWQRQLFCNLFPESEVESYANLWNQEQPEEPKSELFEPTEEEQDSPALELPSIDGQLTFAPGSLKLLWQVSRRELIELMWEIKPFSSDQQADFLEEWSLSYSWDAVLLSGVDAPHFWQNPLAQQLLPNAEQGDHIHWKKGTSSQRWVMTAILVQEIARLPVILAILRGVEVVIPQKKTIATEISSPLVYSLTPEPKSPVPPSSPPAFWDSNNSWHDAMVQIMDQSTSFAQTKRELFH